MGHIVKKSLLIFCGIFLVMLPCTIILSSCSPIDQSDVINSLLPNVWVFISHVFATLILLAAAVWLVWKPTKNNLEKRKNYIANEIAEAEKARKQALEKLEAANQERLQAHHQASAIIESATNQGYQIKDHLEKSARMSANRITNDAQSEAVKTEQKLRKQIHDEMVNIALDAAEALIKKEMDQKTNRLFVEETISQLEKRTLNNDD